MAERIAQNEIDAANHIDLPEFLRSRGETLIHSGFEWRWKRHDSVTMRGNMWFQHSRNQGGYPIDFIRTFFNLNFKDSVHLLLGSKVSYTLPQADTIRKPKPFALPARNANMDKVFGYLVNTRRISSDVIVNFSHNGTLYEELGTHDAVFVGVDENGNARHAHRHGTFYSREKNKMTVVGSDSQYSFHFEGTNELLFVFEAPIDMLSYIDLHRGGWQNFSYLALNGVSPRPLQHFIQQRCDIHTVVLCLDNDTAGQAASNRIAQLLKEDGIYVRRDISQAKDWNEDLKNQTQQREGIILCL